MLNEAQQQCLADDSLFVSALLADGDSRLAIDKNTGRNKYLCPPTPDASVTCLSSCTASPVSENSFARARLLHAAAAGPGGRGVLVRQAQDIAQALGRFFQASDLAEVILCPSGTDGLLTAACLLADERPGGSATAILPCASETGTGVPLAAACRDFDGPPKGRLRADAAISIVEVAVRDADGRALAEDAVNAAFAREAGRAKDRPIVYLTHPTKTGLIAPRVPPEGCDVIVDACQARIDPLCVAGYLERGWPVVVTGSKFFGGPAFCGAVLYPKARGRRVAQSLPPPLGVLLRWTAALDAMEQFAAVAHRAEAFVRRRGAVIRDLIESNPALMPVEGLTGTGPHWSDFPSIFTFALRDRRDRARLLTAEELAPVHRKLAAEGTLVGQPVGLGSFGGLRLAIGARDIIRGEAAWADGWGGRIRSLGL
jgi:hypothetical protein